LHFSTGCQVPELTAFLEEHVKEVLSLLDDEVLSLSGHDLARDRRNIEARVSSDET